MPDKAGQNKAAHDPGSAEIVIAGGGLTGLMMAITLAHTPYNVTLIDRSSTRPKTASSPSLDRRTTTIHAAGARMLDCLGVWAHLADKAAPIWHMHVAEGAATITASMTPKSDFNLHWSHDDAPMAYVVENSHLFAALKQRLTETDVTYIDNSAIRL